MLVPAGRFALFWQLLSVIITDTSTWETDTEVTGAAKYSWV
jgi:hypothetical protein